MIERREKSVCRAMMRIKGIPVSHWVCESPSHPRQMDAMSCGVFALKVCDMAHMKCSLK